MAEQFHEKRYLAFAKNLEEGTLFKKKVEVILRCRNCGYIYRGLEAPDPFPSCDLPRAYFELICEKW